MPSTPVYIKRNIIHLEIFVPKIRHLAIRTEDAGKPASFYVDVFDMQMLHHDNKKEA